MRSSPSWPKPSLILPGSEFCACWRGVSGAAPVATLQTLLAEAGFSAVEVSVRPESREFIKDWFPGSGAEEFVASAAITAVKPGGACCAPECCS